MSRTSIPTRTQEAMEAVVLAVVRDEAGATGADAESDFFTLGLDSLAVAAIVSRLQEQLGLDVSLATAFEHSTSAALAGFLAHSAQPVTSTKPDPATPGELFAGPAMTSYLARRMGPAWEQSPSPVWGAIELPAGTIDVERLRSALDVLPSRHEALLVSLHRRDDEVYARIDEPAPVPLDVVDGQDLDDDQINAVIMERRDRLRDRTHSPLAAVTLIRNATLDVLFMVVDHNVADTWSLRVLLLDIGRLCQGGTPPRPGEPDLTFSQWCAIERRLLAEADGHTADFWCELLAPAQGAVRPGDPDVHPSRLVTRHFTVGHPYRRILLEQASRHGLSLFAAVGGRLVNAVRAVLGTDRVPVAVHSLNRDLAGTATMVASPVRELWLAVDLTERRGAEAAAEAFQACLLPALAHQMTPPFLARREIGAMLGETWAPWVFVAINLAQPTLEFQGEQARLRSIRSAKDASAPVDLHVTDLGDELLFELTTWVGVGEPDTTDRLAATMTAEIAALSPGGPTIRIEDPVGAGRPDVPEPTGARS